MPRFVPRGKYKLSSSIAITAEYANIQRFCLSQRRTCKPFTKLTKSRVTVIKLRGVPRRGPAAQAGAVRAGQSEAEGIAAPLTCYCIF